MSTDTDTNAAETVAGTDDVAEADPIAFRTYDDTRYSDEAVAKSAHAEMLAESVKYGSNLRSGRKLKKAIGAQLAIFRESVIMPKTNAPDYLGDSTASGDAMRAILAVALKGATDAEKRAETPSIRASISRYAKLASQARMEAATLEALPESADKDAQDKAVKAALGKVWSAQSDTGGGGGGGGGGSKDETDDASTVEAARTVVVSAVERLASSPHVARAEAVNRMISAEYLALVAAGSEVNDRPLVQTYNERAVEMLKVIGKVLNGNATKADHDRISDFLISETPEVAETPEAEAEVAAAA